MSSGAYIELVAPDEDDAVDFLFLPKTVGIAFASFLDRVGPGERDFLLRPAMTTVLVPVGIGGGVGVVTRIAERSSATRESPTLRVALLRRCE